MSLRHVVLGLLDREPMSGYDIKKRLREDIPGFWNVSDGQLYPMLRRLAADHLIAVRPGGDGETGERNLWQITDAGRNELHDWLLEPVRRLGDFRDPFLMRLAFFDRLPRTVVDQQIRAQVRQCEAYRELLDELRHQYQPGVTSFQRTLLDYALLGTEIRACFLDVLAEQSGQGRLSRTDPLFDEQQIRTLRAALDEIRAQARDITPVPHVAGTAAA